MLHPTTQAIAESFGYVPFSEEDAPEQFQADITYVLGKTSRPAHSGDVRIDFVQHATSALISYARLWGDRYGYKHDVHR